MDYKIKKKKEEFEPVTVEITLNTRNELAWFTGCINLATAHIRELNEYYLKFDSFIKKSDGLWEELDYLCRKYGLTKD